MRAILEAAMEFGGFDHRSVAKGSDAIEFVRTSRPDAILLDLGLPDMDGRKLLKLLREMSDVPIVICSGRDSEPDRIEALDLGADDFIGKPFLPGEMLARLRAILRRHSGPLAEEQEPFEPTREASDPRTLTLDPDFPVVRFENREVSLSESEYKVLQRLIEDRSGPVPRSAILHVLYGESEDRHTKIVEIYIMRLRRKLKELTGRNDLIQNFRGRGWALRSE